MRSKIVAIVALICFVPAMSSQAQVSPSFYDFARPGLDWYTIETDHFNIHFHLSEEGEGNSRTAQVVARVAEDVYEPITSLYDYEPDSKIDIVLKDYEDYSNGAAYFFDNKIEIWSPSLNSPLRGEHNWLRNVITHEFAHIIQVQTTMKRKRNIPFYYLQWLEYENVRRPDVLYGYPQGVMSYPVPVLNNPAWFAEGTAQYQRAWLDYDQWDTQRDMMLRTRVLAEQELSLTEMGSFYSKSSLMREGVYNHGFAFTRYLANTYGEEVLRDISQSLGKWRNWNMERALEEATGKPGEAVYKDWMDAIRKSYLQQTEEVRANLIEGELVERDGFSNFYPVVSPDGTQIAYVSNRGEDFNRMALYVRDLDSDGLAVYNIEGLGTDVLSHTCAFGHKVKSGVGGKISWRPDGKALVYARHKDTPEGYYYSDLYEITLSDEKAKRLTREERAIMPAYAPDGNSIAFVKHKDGSTNLYVFDKSTEASKSLTAFNNGTQISDPVWHPSGEWIFFALFNPTGHGRDLWRVRSDGTGAEAVLATTSDERSPAFNKTGDFLYYAADVSGIFNIYRTPLSEGKAASGATVQLTQVLGGAFMPNVASNGALVYAQYQWDGYKIAQLKNSEEGISSYILVSYSPPDVTEKQQAHASTNSSELALNSYDDRAIQAFEANTVSELKAGGTATLTTLETESEGESQTLGVRRYGLQFTKFSFFPVLRFDHYVSRRRTTQDIRLPDLTRGEVLLRNTKIGTYFTSREILEGLTMFGGLLIGPASRDASSILDFFSPARLIKLERDAFLQIEYKKGLGFIPKRWSPQFSVELYSIRRNVENGFALEEFPCTACYPDTTLIDISYSLWEADIFARSKITRNVLLEFGYRYSPYKSFVEAFYSKEQQTTIPETSNRYFIGRAFSVKAYFESLHPYKDSDVVPHGVEVEVGYDHERGRLLRSYGVEEGILTPEYENNNNHRLLFDALLGLRFKKRIRGGTHGFGVRARGTTILGDPVDNFYDDYVGGLGGARGYPFYALGGNRTIWLHTSYHFPLWANVRKQFGFTYIDKIYARLFADAAAAWSGPWPGSDAIRPDVGAELRFGLYSHYLLPTAVFVSATYGFDAFTIKLDEGFVTPDGNNFVSYGKEFLWHFGVLFGFDF